MESLKIAVVHGDGIGPEVCGAAVEVLKAALGNRALDLVELPAGAEHYRRTGDAFPDETYAGCRAADAVLHGAAGLPDVRLPDGTEAGQHFSLQVRFRLDLYANVRPVKLYPGVVSPLRGREAGSIDYVIVRENTEGLYAARGGGNVLHDDVATDTLVMTRKGVERIARFACELARTRDGALRDGKRRVTIVDKANVLRSYAWFRKVASEVVDGFPDVERDHCLVDAMTLHMVLKPDFFDVVVVENMFGDIISDLGAATVGGMGMSPTAEIGDGRGLFQAAHGSAPDIAGQGVANPLGTILAGAMMLRWLAQSRPGDGLDEAAGRIERAAEKVLASREALTPDLGGKAKTRETTQAVLRALG